MANYPPKKIRGQKGGQFDFKRDPENGRSDALHRADERLDVSQGTHGTVMFDQPTRHVSPANVHGNVVYENLSDKDRAYYSAVEKPEHQPKHLDPSTTPDPRMAAEISGWNWAQYTASSKAKDGVRARAVVHEVTPEGTVDLDHNLNSEGYSKEMTADRLRITKTNWTPPPEMYNVHRDVVGVQGTLPHINWNQHAAGGENNWKVIRREPRGAVETSLSAETWRRLGQNPPGSPDPARLPAKEEDPRQGKLF